MVQDLLEKGKPHMALSWSIAECDNYKELLEGSEWRKTDSLIWITLIIGMNEITEANKVEFYTRVKMYEGVSGAITSLGGEDYFITPADITRRVGLTTNASRESFSGWTRRVLRLQVREFK